MDQKMFDFIVKVAKSRATESNLREEAINMLLEEMRKQQIDTKNSLLYLIQNVKQGKMVQSVKMIRSMTGYGLADSKNLFESLKRALNEETNVSEVQ